jgi:hypothetical protein
MTDDVTQDTEQAEQPEPTAFVPIATQADLDRIVAQRVGRATAKYGDYDDVKSRLAEVENANKTEVERANDALAKASADAAKAQRELSVLRAASKHGVPADYIDLITGEDEDTIDAVAARVATLAKGSAAAPDPTPGVRFADPGQGAEPAPDEQAVKEAFARQLFNVK